MDSLETRVAVLETKFNTLESNIGRMSARIDAMYEKYIEGRGGFKVLMSVGTACVILGGGLMKVAMMVFR